MGLLDLLFPRLCLGCKKPGTYLCPGCFTKINFTSNPLCPICEKPSPHGLTHPRCQTPLGLDGMFVMARYHPPLSLAIRKFKYKYVSDLTDTLSSLLTEHLKSWPILVSKFEIRNSKFIVVPIPLHPSRFKWRGFNQSELLAKNISEYFNIPIDKESLVRVKKTTPQAELKGKKERTENLKNAFMCQDQKAIAEKTVFLIDDLSTTGETLRGAAQELKRKGAQKVFGIVLARGRK